MGRPPRSPIVNSTTVPQHAASMSQHAAQKLWLTDEQKLQACMPAQYVAMDSMHALVSVACANETQLGQLICM